MVNPREMWIRAEGAYPAIVDEALFLRAREIVDARSRHLSDQDLLDALRALLASKGFLSGLVIDEHEDTPSSSAFRSRFGSLLRAYDRTQDPHLLRAIGRAWSWRRRMEAGEFATIQELAEAADLAERHVSRQLRLAYLAPEIWLQNLVTL